MSAADATQIGKADRRTEPRPGCPSWVQLRERLATLAQTQRAEGKRVVTLQEACRTPDEAEAPDEDAALDTLAAAVRRAMRLSVLTKGTLAQVIGVKPEHLDRASRGVPIPAEAEERLRAYLRQSGPSPLLLAGRR